MIKYIILFMVFFVVSFAYSANVKESFYFTNTEIDTVIGTWYTLSTGDPVQAGTTTLICDNDTGTTDSIQITYDDTKRYHINFKLIWTGNPERQSEEYYRGFAPLATDIVSNGAITTSSGAVSTVSSITNGVTISGTKTTLDVLNDISVNNIWDESQAGHTISATFGAYLNDSISTIIDSLNGVIDSLQSQDDWVATSSALTTVESKIDTFAIISGYLKGAKAYIFRSATVDTIKLVNGTDTIAHYLSYHPSGVSGGAPDSIEVKAP